MPKSLSNDAVRKVEIACLRLSQKAINTLELALADTNIPMETRIKAAKEILDRAIGRPKQTMDASIVVEGGEALIEALKKARARAGLNE